MPVQKLCAVWLFFGTLASYAGPDDYFKIQDGAPIAV